MSTRFDVADAKQEYAEHLAAHKCRTGDGCPVRRVLLLKWYSIAGRLGTDPGDRERGRKQCVERIPRFPLYAA